ncbi:heme lyase NrfEFG subunit NrfE [Photobacterium sagamiensis]|uniref:heme lyase NrfEFG subunit NrfE n=1 Tax=Photobacterium sagamiensis TaxID=2910241 RepID=UPI003D0B163D
MLPEVGHYALILGFVFALMGGTIPLYGLAKKDSYLIRYAWPLSYGAFFSVTTAIVLLGYSFAVDDFSVAYIAHHSNSQLPQFFKVAAVWGGHEGSFLFWLFSLTGWAAAVAYYCRNKDEQFIGRVLVILALLAAAFSLFTLLASNPFLRIFPMPAEGRDLNPMLQDVGLIFHPPMLYLGYVGFAVSFAFALAALTTTSDTVSPASWARWSRPWTLSAWVFLTGGIALGSWWAYYELGWGGWWFWDPVENASLMPWLTGTALLHSLIITEKRKALTSWTLLLSIFTFSLSLLGTFIVRSGVLTSVHAFAVDPTRGLALLAILGVILLTSLTLFALRSGRYIKPVRFGFLSREAAFLAGNSLFAVVTLTILLGTFYPMVFQAFGLGNISVGAPYFNSLFIPLSFLLFAFMGLAPLIRWHRASSDDFITRILAPMAVSVVLGVALSVMFEGGINLVVCIAFIMALWITLTSVQTLYMDQKSRKGWKFDRKCCRQLAMVTAHVGVATALVGATLVSYYAEEVTNKMGPGDQLELGDYQFHYRDTELLIGPNYTAEQANIEVVQEGESLGMIEPQRRHYTVRTMNMSEPGILWSWHGDIYITLGEKLNRTDYAVRIQYKPFVRWLWLGGILMMLGGTLAVLARINVNAYQPSDKKEQLIPTIIVWK